MSDARPPFIDLNYEILTKLREGGMGAVYRVRHRLLDQTRIIKIIRPHLSGDEELGERFLREARAASRLRHPNIALLLDFRVDRDGHEMLVMEHIDGLNLLEILERSGPPPLGLTLEMARQALSALGYLHRQGVVHRDVSPDNLMLTRGQDGEPLVKLIDLGIAKLPAEEQPGLTQAGVFLGKPLYASPEQFLAGGDLDARSDLYSFGVVLYQLLTGRLPFAGGNRRELRISHLFHPPLPFSESDPGGRLPQALRRLVLDLLAKDPAERIADAGEAVDRLEEVAQRFPFSGEDLNAVLGSSLASSTGGSRETPSSITTHPEPVSPRATLPLAASEAETVAAVIPGSVREAPPLLEVPVPATPPPRWRGVTALLAVSFLAALLWLAAGGAQRWWPPEAAAPPALPAEPSGTGAGSPRPSSAPRPTRVADTEPTDAPASGRITSRPDPPATREERPSPSSSSPGIEPAPTSSAPEPAETAQPEAHSIDTPGEESPPSSIPEPLPTAPASVLLMPRPVYPAAALGSGRSVRVTVEVLVGETGTVIGPPTIKGLISDEADRGVPPQRRGPDPYNALFREAALEAVRRTRFVPAVREGVPVEERATLVVEITPP